MADEPEAPEAGLTSLHQLLARHLEILKEHAAVINEALEQRAQEPDNPLRRRVQKCARDTKTMLQHCEDESVALLKFISSIPTTTPTKRNSEVSEHQPTKKKAKQKHESNSSRDANSGERTTTTAPFAPPVNDPSGLFIIDSNPTPVEELLNQNQKNTNASHSRNYPGSKRRRSSQDQAAPTQAKVPELNELNGTTSSTKRKKTNHETSEVQNQPRTQEHAKDEDEEYAEAFERKVALRLKEKDEVQKAKANKKRKRRSNMSVDSDTKVQEYDKADPVNPGLTQHLEPTLKPSKRRKQELQEESAARDDGQEEKSGVDIATEQSEVQPRKRKRGRMRK